MNNAQARLTFWQWLDIQRNSSAGYWRDTKIWSNENAFELMYHQYTADHPTPPAEDKMEVLGKLLLEYVKWRNNNNAFTIDLSPQDWYNDFYFPHQLLSQLFNTPSPSLTEQAFSFGTITDAKIGTASTAGKIEEVKSAEEVAFDVYCEAAAKVGVSNLPFSTFCELNKDWVFAAMNEYADQFKQTLPQDIEQFIKDKAENHGEESGRGRSIPQSLAAFQIHKGRSFKAGAEAVANLLSPQLQQKEKDIQKLIGLLEMEVKGRAFSEWQDIEPGASDSETLHTHEDKEWKDFCQQHNVSPNKKEAS